MKTPGTSQSPQRAASACRRLIRRFTLGLFLPVLLTTFPAATFGQDDPSKVGKWDLPFNWPNIGIHVHVLPDGKVLFWGRREWGPGGPLPNPEHGRPSLDPHECTPRIWDPQNPTATPQALQSPALRASPDQINLFCSGHTFLPDGKLFVVGGHLDDFRGSHKVRIYDPVTKTWSIGPPMGPPGEGGRWYPTAVTLPDGSVLVAAGADQKKTPNNKLQIFKNGIWTTIAEFVGIPLYPMMHVAPDGRVFMSGPSKERKTQLLDTSSGQWQVVGDTFKGKDRDYGSSVMYDVGKVVIIGGGIAPQDTAEVIDLNQPAPVWQSAGKMSIGRRHHNATILPDGSVFVNGGTSGKGGPNKGFNDIGAAVKKAELWDPSTLAFTPMAAESVPRWYHSTAVLLPDARVLSAGGGEYRPDNVAENDPKDSHREVQIFSPPYLFRGPRPDITVAPDEVGYGQVFDVGTSHPENVGMVNMVRLSSVTHAFNQNQRINFLTFTVESGKLKVTAPQNSKVCPPGHYMLFVLNKDKVPSIAKIIRVH